MISNRQDDFEFEPDFFSGGVREIAVPLFDEAVGSLERQRKAIDEKFEEAYSQAADGWEQVTAMGDSACRETDLDLQAQVIGAAVLAYVCAELKRSLRSMAAYFEIANPPSRSGYTGKNWLLRIRQEYLARFQIDMARSPVAFVRIEELFLARNAGVHSEEEDAVTEYLHGVGEPRFVDEIGQFAVTREKFLEAVEDAELFVRWIHSELKLLPNRGPGVSRWRC